MKVVIVRAAPEEIKRLIVSQFPDQWEVVVVSAGQLKEAIKNADAIIPEHTGIDAPLLDKADNLKLVQTGAGYDNVSIEACTKRGIYVANAAGINATAVAEHVFAYIFCWYKNIVYLDAALKDGNFSMGYGGSELSRKVIGIVGLGHIGKAVGRFSESFGMKVLGCHTRPMDTGFAVEWVGLETLLGRSDIVTLHVSLNQGTRHMIGRNELEMMRKDAFLINTSRGSVVDETALTEALQTDQIGGAGLDVFETEPLPEDNPLRKLNNVILTPHTAGEPDALYFHSNRFKFFAENIQRVSEGKPPQNALNRIKPFPRQL
jgi:phosphoglycerate dehydrogenase-like enzyme